MLIRLRSTFLASGGALLLVLSLSGLVAAASILQVVTAPVADPTEPTAADTTATFEDLDGNGVDDDCQTDVVENADAALAAETAADLNGDGTISVDEAAQSGRTGGKSCNHGGYVSGVAHCDGTQTTETSETTDVSETSDETSETTDVSETTDLSETTDESVTTTETAAETTTSASTACADETTDATDTAAPAVCPPVVTPAVAALTTFDTEPVALVRDVAQDTTAVGGKNCNHGGAVSEAAHAANAARSAARDAAKVARDAARAARASERAAAHAARLAAHGAKTHGKGHKG